MQIFKLQEDICIDGCPYYKSPAYDIDKDFKVHTCTLQYLECKELSHLKDNCPLFNVEDMLEDFMRYVRRHNMDFNMIFDMQLASRLVYKFVEEELE